MRRSLSLLSIAALLVGGSLAEGCAPEPAAECLEPSELAWPELRYVVAAREGSGVRVRGFSGAAPPGVEISLQAEDAAPVVTALADERGRFDVSYPEEADPLTITVAGEHATLRVRERKQALACVPEAPRAVGAAPNDLELGRCGEELLALVATSTDGALERVALEGEARSAVSFPPDDGLPANPWAVALHGGGRLAAVTLFGHHEVALVDACSGEVLQRAGALDDEGAPLVVEVAPPVTLATPWDADGDGAADAQVNRMLARHPEGVAFVGDQLLVSYVNLLEVGPPARFGPGLVISYTLDGERLRPAGHTLLPFQNPQSITLDDEGRPWVSCSGALERGTASYEAASDGGLVRLDPVTLEAVHVLSLGRFAPATPAVTRAGVVVGSLLEGRLAHLPTGATSLDDGQLLATGAEGTESLFEVLTIGGGLALATGFTADSLVVVDVAEGVLHPWPFTRALALGRDGDLFRGLKAVARVPEGALVPGAPDAAALLALSSEVVPLRLWQVLGP